MRWSHRQRHIHSYFLFIFSTCTSYGYIVCCKCLARFFLIKVFHIKVLILLCVLSIMCWRRILGVHSLALTSSLATVHIAVLKFCILQSERKLFVFNIFSALVRIFHSLFAISGSVSWTNVLYFVWGAHIQGNYCWGFCTWTNVKSSRGRQFLHAGRALSNIRGSEIWLELAYLKGPILAFARGLLSGYLVVWTLDLSLWCLVDNWRGSYGCAFILRLALRLL